MLPAILAGVGILAVAGIFFFGSGEEDERSTTKNGVQRKTEAAKTTGNGPGRFRPREADAATSAPSAATHRLNPRLKNSAANSMMAEAGKGASKREVPDSFASPAAERAYWLESVKRAERMVEMRQRAVERLPKMEETMLAGRDPEQARPEFERRSAIVEQNFAKAQTKLEQATAKLEGL